MSQAKEHSSKDEGCVPLAMPVWPKRGSLPQVCMRCCFFSAAKGRQKSITPDKDDGSSHLKPYSDLFRVTSGAGSKPTHELMACIRKGMHHTISWQIWIPSYSSPRDSSHDESRKRERSPHVEIRAPVHRTPRYTAPEYRRLFRTQPPREPNPVPETSNDEAESKDTSESAPSSGSSSGLYSTDTSSSNVTSGRRYDSTDRSSGSSSDVTFGSDPRFPCPTPSVSSGSYTSEDDLVDRYFVGTFPQRSPI
ncbi:hypothetical protein PIB30_072286 [Stylosanthes scabra]|uniref:Uncharacterized protein n=1 Tax=Stylosanthes scabra TaxID=79078 RepID=A0ABU6RPI6_9FABA|nr:hypothetical protein [Stylosanthes scabra]